MFLGLSLVRVVPYRGEGGWLLYWHSLNLTLSPRYGWLYFSLNYKYCQHLNFCYFGVKTYFKMYFLYFCFNWWEKITLDTKILLVIFFPLLKFYLISVRRFISSTSISRRSAWNSFLSFILKVPELHSTSWIWFD